MHEIVGPIRHKSDWFRFKKYWYQNSPAGPRNWMIFQLGILTALRASDLCKLTLSDVYNKSGVPKYHLVGHDIKTHKANCLLIEPLASKLENYRHWLIKKNDYIHWLFPVCGNPTHPIRPNYIYKALHDAAKRLHIPNVGSHSLRKTFGYFAYKKTHNLVYVMKMLNHSDPSITLRYIGIEQENIDKITAKIFG